MGICKVKLSSSARHVLGKWKKRVSLYLGFCPSLSQCFSLKTEFTRRPPSPGREMSLLLYRSCHKCDNLDVPWNEMLWWRSTSSLCPQLLGHCPLMSATKGPLLPALELSCCGRVLGSACRWELSPELPVLTLTAAQVASSKKLLRQYFVFFAYSLFIL